MVARVHNYAWHAVAPFHLVAGHGTQQWLGARDWALWCNWARCMYNINTICSDSCVEATSVCADLPPAGGSIFMLGGKGKKWQLPTPFFSKKSPTRSKLSMNRSISCLPQNCVNCHFCVPSLCRLLSLPSRSPSAKSADFTYRIQPLWFLKPTGISLLHVSSLA